MVGLAGCRDCFSTLVEETLIESGTPPHRVAPCPGHWVFNLARTSIFLLTVVVTLGFHELACDVTWIVDAPTLLYHHISKLETKDEKNDYSV